MKQIKSTMPQQRFWLEWKLDPEGIAYNLPYLFEINGDLNIGALKNTFEYYVNKLNEGCRTHFIEVNGQPEQVIFDKVEVELEQLDVSNTDKNKQKKLQEDFVNKITKTPFDLAKGPLFRFGLVKKSKSDYLLVINFHHIIFDGVTYLNFIDQISELYNHYGSGKKLSKDFSDKQKNLSIQNYIKHEKSYSNKDLKNDLDYWKNYMSGSELGSNLPYQKQAGVSDNLAKAVSFTLDEKLTKKLKEIAKSEKSSLFRILSLLYGVLLGRYCGQEAVALSYAVHLLPKEMQGLNGCFVNNLPLRVGVDSQKSFKQLLKELDSARREGRKHQNCSFTSIANALKEQGEDQSLNVGISESPGLLRLHNLKFENLKINSLQIDEFAPVFDFSLDYEIDEKINFKLDYAAAKFDSSLIEQFVSHFNLLVESFIDNLDQSITKVDFLTKDERKQILIYWNDTAAPYPKDKTIYQLFEDQVKKTPDNIAVVFENEKLSYSDLNKKSNQLAHLIRAKYKKQNKKDLKPDSLIGLCVERSLDMIIGILGILKAGAAYVPLDPDYPQDRLEYMIEDSHEGLVITQKDIVAKDGFLDKLHHDELLVIDSDEVKADLKKQSADNLAKVSGPDNLAYVIYTSGSTGRPKGVMIEHRNLVNHMIWMIREFKFNSSDVIFQKTPYSFDASVWELFLPFIIGAKGVVSGSSGHKDPQYLVDKIISEKITVVQFVPALLDLIMNDYSSKIGSSKLKRIFCGGEALKLTTNISKLDLQKIKLCNLYGPTESTIDSSFNDNISLLNSEPSSIPIGMPIDNIKLYILDNNLNPCPIGAPGELYIGGAGLARGYLNQDKLTRERFISNPFAQELGLSKSDRIYKTGDLVRWLPDGNIEYLGRTDFQVKIRGFRIELGEIENVLAKHKSISQVSVIDKEKEGSKYLVAYYVIAKGKKDPEIDALRDYLSETLPDYMVPAAFVKLDKMPLTPNGKINRRALPDPDMSLMGEEYVAPRNEIEKKLAEIWSDVLKIDKDKVGIHDNFFHLGGHSLLAIQLVARIHAKLNCEISIKQLFDKPKLMDLSLFIEGQIKAGAGVTYSPIKKTKLLKDGNAMSFAQERLWFLNEFEGSNENYNIPIILRLEGKLDIKALNKSLNQLIVRHASFRTVFIKDKTGVGVQKILDKLELNLVAEKLDNKAKGKDLEKIIKVEIDPSKTLADINQIDNSFTIE